MFQAVKYCNSKYTASLNKVLDALEQMEAAEQAEEDWIDESREPDGDFADGEPDDSEYGYGEEDADEQPE